MQNILVVGSGGREHAILKKLSNARLFCCSTTFNPVINNLVDDYLVVDNYDDIDITIFCRDNSIKLAVIGPESALDAGIVDKLESVSGTMCVGPRKFLAQIETSKVFARKLLDEDPRLSKFNPSYHIFQNYDKNGLLNAFSSCNQEYVIKPDGLHSGKGVQVSGIHFTANCEALAYCKEILERGEKLLIEEKLYGQEFTLMAMTDGHEFTFFPPIKDYKLLNDGDTGPNTGGMGCELININQITLTAAKTVVRQTIHNLNTMFGHRYKGIIYGNFIILPDKTIKVIEFNSRFGDPEGILALQILVSDFQELCNDIVNETLSSNATLFDFSKEYVLKYLVPWHYPNSMMKGHEFYVTDIHDRYFFSGVTGTMDKLIMTGSRTVAVIGDNAQHADSLAQKIIGPLTYRKDIGKRELRSYQDAGVNIEEGNLTVSKIKQLLPHVGSFGGLIKIGAHQNLVFSIDGVGTKSHFVLKYSLNRDTALRSLGYDLVNHCVNDILVEGASPMAFLDYYASSQIKSDDVYNFVRGLKEACDNVGCVLVGGETAEMPITYQEHACDLVGAITGIVTDNSRICGKQQIKKGDLILALPSSGLHTNGYSLVNALNANPDTIPLPVLKRLLAPHRCYYKDIKILTDQGIRVHGLCHITGGGLIDNPPRVLPDGMTMIQTSELTYPVEIEWIRNQTNLTSQELLRTFNCGIGMLVFVAPEDFQQCQHLLPYGLKYGYVG